MSDARKRRSSGASRISAPAPLRSLLLPIDLTPSSDRVIGRLMHLPLAEGVRVTLLHVVPGSLAYAEQRIAVRDARRAITEEAAHLRSLMLGRLAPEKFRIEAVVRTGAPATEIAACAARTGAELILVGRTGARPWRDAFLGSTAERVIRQARIPVLAVRLAPRRRYAIPAVALDFDPAAEAVVAFLLRMLAFPRCPVDVIHAFNTPYRGLVYPSLPVDVAANGQIELRTRAHRRLKELLASATAKAGVDRGDAPVWKIHVRHGWPRLVVEKVTTRAQTDLLVAGTRARSGAAYLALGTVAGDLLRSSKCDVLMVPPP